MYYVIQEKLFREENYENLIRTLERLELDYEIIKLQPNNDNIIIHTDRKDIFPFGAVRMAKIASKYLSLIHILQPNLICLLVTTMDK